LPTPVPATRTCRASRPISAAGIASWRGSFRADERGDAAGEGAAIVAAPEHLEAEGHEALASELAMIVVRMPALAS
jgi:hypothetical protein